MFFKVTDGKDGDTTLIGRISIPRPNAVDSYKVLRCLSVPMSEVDAVLRSVILQGRSEVEAADVMGLNFKKSPSTRGILPNLKKGQRGEGWVPSMEVLFAMGHEFEQFLAFVNQLKAELVENINNNPELLTERIKGGLKLIAGSYSTLGAVDKQKIREAIGKLD